MDDLRQAHRRLTYRLLAATVLAFFTVYVDLKPDPKSGRALLACASMCEKLATVFFTMVAVRIATTRVVMERMRESREDCDMYLFLGSIHLWISLALWLLSPFLLSSS